jgi:P-type Cu2+ transporter
MRAECFHCGLPVPETGARRLAILGTVRELCCAGCEAVARTIVEAGLESYYQTRSGPVPLPASSGQKVDFSGNATSLVLEGVRCSACLWLIEQALRRQPGVMQVEINYATRRAAVSWTNETTLDAILAAVRAIGYAAHPYDPEVSEVIRKKEKREALWRLFVAAFGAMQVMMYAFPAYVDEVTPEALQLMRWASLLITTPVLLVSCRPFFAGAAAELRNARVGLDTPIALGLGVGFAASAWATVTGGGEVYFDSISMLAFLLLGARWVEASVRQRAGRMLDPLLGLPRKTLPVGSEAVIAPGERIPADGIVIAGASSADESLLTGESRPVAKGEGDEFFAGSVNLEQPVTLRVTRAGPDTRAAGIARLVERGIASRPRVVEAADRVARGLTAAIVLTALGAGIYAGNFWIAVAVLVVACPCALALAAPVVLTRASGALLGAGVLMTRARALDALARATDVVLDKTGTLTTGRLRITGIERLNDASEQECLRIAASLEATSRHPIARAFSAAKVLDVENPRSVAGKGIEGAIGGRRYRIGSAGFCGTAGAARVYLADERGLLAAFDLEDELRPEALSLIARLKNRSTVHLASGDRPEAVRAIASRLGITRWHAGMTPEAKFAFVEKLQAAGRTVVMIGDGINDAPVLARADTSFAMGTGADVAQLQADFVLMKGLGGMLRTMTVASAAMRLVRQNIGWAIAYNALALPLAALGFIGPWEAAIAMGASSASVLLNALRPLESKEWKASTSSFPSRSPSYS